jgi:type VI secretion system protein ImpC
MDVTKPELEEDLKSATDLSQSVYCQWVAGDWGTDLTGHPWAVVCGNYTFEPVVDDIAALMRISQVGAAAKTSFLSAMSSRVLGVDDFSTQTDSATWRIDAESSEAKLWNALRSTRESEYLGLGSLRMLVRAPYGVDSDPTETFLFEEMDGQNRHEDYLWINPAFACASVLTRNFRESGWAIAAGMNRDVDGLPMHVFRVAGEKVTKPCAEIAMTERGVERIVSAGLIPLVSFRDSDRVRVASFQSAALSEERIRGRWY